MDTLITSPQQKPVLPIEVQFNLGRFVITQQMYDPNEYEQLTSDQQKMLRAPSKLLKIFDPHYGASLVLHVRAFEEAIEEQFKRGKLGYRWKKYLPFACAFVVGLFMGVLAPLVFRD